MQPRLWQVSHRPGPAVDPTADFSMTDKPQPMIPGYPEYFNMMAQLMGAALGRGGEVLLERGTVE